MDLIFLIVQKLKTVCRYIFVYIQAPYIIYVEVVEVEDIHASPVVARAMNTLRHTKSEENLIASSYNNNNNHMDAEESIDCWSQEDDDISQQVS